MSDGESSKTTPRCAVYPSSLAVNKKGSGVGFPALKCLSSSLIVAVACAHDTDLGHVAANCEVRDDRRDKCASILTIVT